MERALTQIKPRTMFKTKAKLNHESKEIILFLEDIKSRLLYAELCLDSTRDTLLIDSIIYEIKSLEKKYDYYFKLSKEKNIVINYPNVLTKFPAS